LGFFEGFPKPRPAIFQLLRQKRNSRLRPPQFLAEIDVSQQCQERKGRKMETTASGKSILSRSLLIMVFLFTLASLIANAANGPKPVFIKAACLGRSSSAVLSSFREEVRSSQKYQLVPDLSDNGLMDVVLTIDMNCTERNDIAAVATVFGMAKCFGAKNCNLKIDGSSLRSDLCDSNGATECGRTLFKTFDTYTGNPLGPPLRLN
jgi:hypothetical protein